MKQWPVHTVKQEALVLLRDTAIQPYSDADLLRAALDVVERRLALLQAAVDSMPRCSCSCGDEA